MLFLHLPDRYMAPEVYRRESYGKSVDIFSFALIVHEVTLSKILQFAVYLQYLCGLY